MKILFLPGVSGDPAFWRPVADLLPSSWTKHLFGWPGLGTQPPSPDINSFDDLVTMVEREIDGPVALVAQSMGGVLGMRIALRHRASISHLVLTATSGGVDRSLFGLGDWRPDYRRNFPQTGEWVYERPEPLEGELPSLAIPTLLIWATRDPISPGPVGRHLARVLPQARLVELDDDSHLFARDRAAEIAPLIRAHLEAPGAAIRP